MRQLGLSIAVLVSAAGLALSASSTSAQDIQWAAGVSGNWNDAAKWNPANVPDNSGENAVLSVAGTYTATYNLQVPIGGLNVSRKSATVAMLDGSYLLIYANAANNGKIIINSNLGTTNTFLRFDYGDHYLDGTGQVIMKLGSDDLNDARIDTYGATLYQGKDHTIRGAGNIGAVLVNNGTLIADVNGSTLQLVDQAKTNNALMKAAAGSNFQVSGISVTQGSAGMLLAEGGQVTLASAGIVGGTLATSGPGQIRNYGGSSLNSVVNQATLNLNDGSYILVYGGLTNDGVITINDNAGGTNTYLRFDWGDQTLSGSGEVRLVVQADDLNDARLDTYGSSLTIGADQLIHGAGNVGANMINYGRVIADVNGSALQLVDNPKTNNALMKAAAGSNFQVNGVALTQGPDGVLLAEEGRVTIYNATIAGGTLESSGAGQVRTYAAANLDGVVNKSVLNISDASAAYIHGGLTNDGVITINDNAGTTNTYMRFDWGEQLLSGSGEIRLVLGSDDVNDARLDTYGSTLTIGADQLIHGAGNVGANLVNKGLLIADVNGSTLQMVDNNKINNTLMKAVKGSNLQVNGIAITQSPDAMLLADEGQVTLYNATIVGGRLNSSGDGQVRVAGGNNLNGVVTNEGRLNVSDGAAVYVHDGLINNGLITINDNAGTANTVVRFDWGDLTLGGTGTVRLVLGSDDINDAILGTYGASLVFGPGQTIEGNGRFSGGPFTVQGTIAPGDSVGQIDVQGNISLASTATYKAQIAAANSFDQLTVSGVATVGGEVNISLLNGFVPDTCFAVPIVTAGSVQGAFDTVRGDPGNGRVWRIAYTPTQARAYVTCYADMAVDCQLDLFDFLAFVNLFNDNDPVADCTADGSFDLFDFLCFVNAFNQGCG